MDSINAVIAFLPRWMIPDELRRLGATIGADTIIAAGLRLANLEGAHDLGRLRIGSHCYIGAEVLLDLTSQITLEDEVTLSPRVTLLTHQDVGERPLAKLFPVVKRQTTLRRGCWVGAGVTILGGVEVGEMSVVAAGALVAKDVPARTVVAGVPARVIRNLETLE